MSKDKKEEEIRRNDKKELEEAEFMSHFSSAEDTYQSVQTELDETNHSRVVIRSTLR